MDPQLYYGMLGQTAFPQSNFGNNYGPGYAPVASPQPYMPRFGTENLPFTGNLIGRMTMPFIAHQLMRGQQIAMTGYGHDQNLYDQMRNRQLLFASRQATSMSAALDQENQMRTMRGLFRAGGEPFDAGQRQFSRSVTRGLTSMSPFLAETQQGAAFLESMGGMAGSAAVLSRRLFDTGRYQIDPVSGQFGLSTQSVNAMTRDIYQTAMRQPSRFGSMTAGQLGDMYGQLQSRGMTTMGGNPMNTMMSLDPSMLASAAKRQNVSMSGGVSSLSVKDVDKLLGDDQVANKLRAFDSVKVKQTLEGYSKAIDAIKDIMGDNGEHNAPMQKIFSALEEMSMGSMNRMGASRVSQMIGQTYAISKRVGMPIENVLALQRHGADVAARLGLDPSFAMGAAQQGMLANGAYRNMGLGQQNYFGAMNVNEFTQAGANSYLTASASQSAKNLAAIVRAYETDPAGAKDPTLKAIVTAAKAGQGSFIDPATGKSRNLSFDNMSTTNLMQRAGLTQSAAQQVMRQDYALQATINKYDLGKSVMPAQGDELRTMAAAQTGAIVRMSLGQRVSDGAASSIADKASQGIISDLGRLQPSEMQDPQKVQAIVKRHLSADSEYNKLPATEKAKIERELSLTLPGHLDEMTRNSQFGQFQNFANAMSFTSPNRFKAEARLNQQASFDSRARESLRSLNKGGGLLMRVVSSLQDVKLTDTAGISQVVAGVLGVPTKEVSSKLTGLVTDIEKARRGFAEKQAAIDKVTDPAERERLTKELEAHELGMKATADQFVALATKEGLYNENGFTSKDINDVNRMRLASDTTRSDLAGIGGNFSTQVTAAQGSAAIERIKGKATTEDAMLYIKTKNLAAADAGSVPDWYSKKIKAANPTASDAVIKAKYIREEIQGRSPSAQQITEAQQQLNAGKLDMDEGTLSKFGRVLANRDRERVNPRASRQEIEQYAAANPSMSHVQIEAVLNASRRADRLGLTEAEIGSKRSMSMGYYGDVNKAIQKRLDAFYDPTMAEINKHGGITKEGYAGAMGERQKARDTGFNYFKGSADYYAVQDEDSDLNQMLSGNASRIIAMGKQGQGSVATLEAAQKINALLAEKQNLTDSYFDGDAARAQAGVSTLDLSKSGNARTERDASRRLAAINAELGNYAKQGMRGMSVTEGTAAQAKADQAEIASLFGNDKDADSLAKLLPKYRALGGSINEAEDFLNAGKSLDAAAKEKGVTRDTLIKNMKSDDDMSSIRDRYLKGVGMGVTESDVAGLKKIRDRLGEKFEEESLGQGNIRGQVDSYLKLFGSDANETRRQEIADAAGRGGGHTLSGRLQDARSLAAVAAAGQALMESGTDADKVKARQLSSAPIPMLLSEYNKVSGSDYHTKEFRKTYGLTKDEDFTAFKRRADRFKGRLRGGELDTGQMLTDFESARTTEEQREQAKTSQGQGKDKWPSTLKLTGSVRLEGGSITMDTKTSGQLSNV